MSEQLLAVLKICLLALLYLFFLRVLRAVWAEVRIAGATQVVASAPGRTRSRRRGSMRLVTVEPPDAAGIDYPVTGELTIGRAAGCGIVLDDTFLSQVHARVDLRGEDVWVEDMGSTNGTYVNGRRVTDSSVVRPGDRLQVGNVVMELR